MKKNAELIKMASFYVVIGTQAVLAMLGLMFLIASITGGISIMAAASLSFIAGLFTLVTFKLYGEVYGTGTEGVVSPNSSADSDKQTVHSAAVPPDGSACTA